MDILIIQKEALQAGGRDAHRQIRRTQTGRQSRFIMILYADGNTETKTEPPGHPLGGIVKLSPEAEEKGGIKSVTIGTITINGSRKETTATTQTETSERKAETKTNTRV